MLPGCGRKGDLYLPDASTSDTSDTPQKKKQQTQ
jgi:predicted small lipoprotein YifL